MEHSAILVQQLFRKVVYNYNVDNGPIVSKEITGLNAAPLSDFQVSHPDVWASAKRSLHCKILD